MEEENPIQEAFETTVGWQRTGEWTRKQWLDCVAGDEVDME